VKTLKYALIGCGRVAAKHLKAARFLREDLDLAALVDSRPGAPADLLRSCGFANEKAAAIPKYQDYLAMLAEIKPDLVAITTPSGTHFTIARAAIETGAHVLIEKPLTLSLEEADMLLELAKSRKVLTAVGHIYRFFPLVEMLQADLRHGIFGRILFGDVQVRWGHDQAYYDQAAWRGTWAQDGGALMNQSIHALDLMTWLLGSPVTEVSGWIARLTHRIEAEDFGIAMLHLENGGFCQVEGTTCTDPNRQEASFTIICSEGELRCGIAGKKPYVRIVDGHGRNLTWRYLARFSKWLWRQGGLRAFLGLRNPHIGLYRDLIQAIRSNRAPLADGRSGRDAVELILAIYKSAREQKAVTLPLQGFSILDMAGFFPSC
jgi:UDP-N-acetyl-2-amino-2-deoxyglucuronate dehydrogenase